jgi:pimeloyl-ACP methyl ester carboxylesterase
MSPVVPQGAARRHGARPQDILQDQLAHLWECVLAVERVDIDDTFASLGGTAVHAARLIALIARECDVPLAGTAVTDGTTVETLAGAVLALLPTAAVVTVQAGDPQRRPPLFFLHGDFAGGGFYVRALARGLGSDQPVVVLQHEGMHGEAIPDTIEAIAEDARQRLRHCWPAGPFVLGGHCAGGLIAFEIARQLGDTGQLRSLVLVEPPLARLGRTLPPPLPRLPERMTDVRYRRAYAFSQYATRAARYCPGWYAGALGVFVGEQSAGSRDPYARVRLSALAGDVAVHVVPGTHITMLGRGVGTLAAAMRSFLHRSAESPGRTSRSNPPGA